MHAFWVLLPLVLHLFIYITYKVQTRGGSIFLTKKCLWSVWNTSSVLFFLSFTWPLLLWHHNVILCITHAWQLIWHALGEGGNMTHCYSKELFFICIVVSEKAVATATAVCSAAQVASDNWNFNKWVCVCPDISNTQSKWLTNHITVATCPIRADWATTVNSVPLQWTTHTTPTKNIQINTWL